MLLEKCGAQRQSMYAYAFSGEADLYQLSLSLKAHMLHGIGHCRVALLAHTRGKVRSRINL